MDQMEDHILKKLNRNQFLKRTLQFIFSVSVFCIFVWYSSGFSIHPQSFNVYFSTCLFSMFTHTLERKYMFLICNGILVFLAKTSSAFISDSDFNILSETKTPVSDMIVVPLESQENVPLIVEEQEKKSEEVSDQGQSSLNTKPEGTESEEEEEEEASIADAEEEGTESEVIMETEDDEVEETTMMATTEELVNTEELNRKFEEFIRRMKEEIRIEAQRQLIAV